MATSIFIASLLIVGFFVYIFTYNIQKGPKTKIQQIQDQKIAVKLFSTHLIFFREAYLWVFR